MAAQTALLPIARLRTEIDNVRFTATTTLKIFMRESCGHHTLLFDPFGQTGRVAFGVIIYYRAI